jgi:hypothetical protein
VTDTKFASEDELWGLVKVFSERADELEKKLQASREAHHLEGTGWIRLYQTLQTQNATLKAEIARLRSEHPERQQ